MDNFFQRTVTGAGIVIFILGGFWLHPLSFCITGLVLLWGSMHEYYSIIKNNGNRPQNIFGLAGGIMIYIVSTLVAAGFIGKKYMLLLLLLVPALTIRELYRKDDEPFQALSQTFFPLLYIALPFSLFPFASFMHAGLSSIIPQAGMVFSPGLIIGFFLLVWTNDTGAYLAGVTAGRHKLMERISPKKTWEGFFGGLIATAAVSFLLSGWLGITGRTGWLIISLIIVITGTYGDLAESMLKRSTGVKDSGTILPGHGGFLDRFDSTILAFPVVYLFVTLFG